MPRPGAVPPGSDLSRLGFLNAYIAGVDVPGMEMAEQGGAEPRAGKALGGAPALAGRTRLLAVHRAAGGGAKAAVAAEADMAKPGGKAGGVLEDNSEFIRESIQERLQERIQKGIQEGIQERLQKGIQEGIQERIDYDLRVRLPQTLARANALQMAFDSC